jgi:hypothetical protein
MEPMHLLLCLLLGHFLGDFPLQTNHVFAAKIRGWPGVALHAGLVGGITMLLIWPYGLAVIAGVAVVTVLHGAIDQAKIVITRKKPGFPISAFLLDQGIHLGLLVLLAYWAGFPELNQKDWSPWLSGTYIFDSLVRLYLDPKAIAVALAYVISLFFGVIWVQTFTVSRVGSPGSGLWLSPLEKWAGIAERGLITTGVWFSNLPLLLLGFSLPFIVHYVSWRNWMSLRFFLTRTAASFLLSVAVGLGLKLMS